MVIGVTPKNFANLGTENPDVWLPLMQHSYFVEGSKSLSDPKFDGVILMWGRLAAGVNFSQAEHELLALTDQLRKLYPAVIWDHERILVTPGAHFFPSSFKDDPPVLPFVALLVLLILAVACANLGGLLMARGVNRRREIQLRLDLGARKSRLFRQLLTESLLLGLLGSIAALPLSYIILRFALVYANAPSWMSALPDWRVLLFTAAMGFLAALFFGMLTTLQMIRRKKERTLWHQLVVCAQVGASCVLLILAGLLVRATLHTLYTDPGFGYEQVVSIDPLLRDHGFTSSAAQNYLDQLQNRLRGVPGVISVSMALSPPLVNTEVMITSIDVDGHQVLIYPNWGESGVLPDDGHSIITGPLSPHRRNTCGHPERIAGPQAVADGRPNRQAMERRQRHRGRRRWQHPCHGAQQHRRNRDLLPSLGRRSSQNVGFDRTAGPFDALLPTIKQIAGNVDPKLFPAITPLKAGFRNHVAQAEQIATIISLLGSIAIFLAVVGLLGLVAYAVSQRTKELAIRLALGASHAEIFFICPATIRVAGRGSDCLRE